MSLHMWRSLWIWISPPPTFTGASWIELRSSGLNKASSYKGRAISPSALNNIMETCSK